MDRKDYIKSQILFLIIPGIMIAVGLIWPSFYWLCIGIFTAAIVIINTIVCLIKNIEKDNEFAGAIGLCCLIIIVALFTFAYWSYNESRFVFSNGDKQHIYADCPSFKPESKIKKVCELEGFLYGCFSDCKLCKQRKEEETKRKREVKAQRKRQMMISKLQDAIKDLENGKSVVSVAESLSNYFLDEEYIEIEEDYDEVYIRGVPSRYQ